MLTNNANGGVQMIEVEAWVLVDEDGGYEIAKEADELQSPAGLASRLVKITLKVPTPAAVELSAVIAGEAAGGTLAVA